MVGERARLVERAPAGDARAPGDVGVLDDRRRSSRRSRRSRRASRGGRARRTPWRRTRPRPAPPSVAGAPASRSEPTPSASTSRPGRVDRRRGGASKRTCGATAADARRAARPRASSALEASGSSCVVVDQRDPLARAPREPAPPRRPRSRCCAPASEHEPHVRHRLEARPPLSTTISSVVARDARERGAQVGAGSARAARRRGRSTTIAESSVMLAPRRRPPPARATPPATAAARWPRTTPPSTPAAPARPRARA